MPELSNKTKSKLFTVELLAILSIFWLGGGNGWVQASYQSFSDGIGVDYQTVLYVFSTIPSILTLIFSLISGYICGRWVPFKVMAIIGTALFSFGMLPLFISEWNILIVSRVLYAVGCGLITPMAQALTMHMYKGDDNARVQGWGVTTMKIANIAVATIVGAVVTIQYQYAFAVYGFGLLALALTLLTLPMDHIDKAAVAQSDAEREAQKEARKQQKFPAWCWCWVIIVALGYFCSMPINMNNSGIVVGQEAFGTPMDSAMIGNIMNIGGMVTGALMGYFSKSLGRFMQPIALAVAVIGELLIGFGPRTLMTFYLGGAIYGLGFNTITAMSLAEGSRYVPEVWKPFLAGACLAGVNLVGTIVPFVMTWEYAFFNTTDKYVPIQIGGVIFAIMVVIIFVCQMRANAKDGGARGIGSGLKDNAE